MLKWFKKYFIPHEKNEHKPHLLRWESAVVILSAVLFIEIGFLSVTTIIFPNSNFFASIVESVLIQQTNSNRQTTHLASLVTDSLLTQAAQARAEDMAKKGYFSHTSPEGYLPWHWFDQVGYKYQYAGENLAVNFSDSKDTVNAWMESPTHRANILDAHYTRIGIGIASGKYEGRDTVFVVQFFARPAVEIVKQVPAKSPIAQNSKQGVMVPVSSATSSASTTVGAVSVLGEVESAKTQAETVASDSGLIYEAKQFLKSLAASPRNTIEYLFLILATIITITLVLTIGVKVKVQYPRILLNGVVMIIIIASALILNYYIVAAQVKIF